MSGERLTNILQFPSHFHFTRPLHMPLAETMIDLNVSSTFCARSDIDYYEK